jgi:hypothetical protein
MVRKKTYLALMFIVFLIPINNSYAAVEPFSFQDKIIDTTSIFFLVALEVNDTIQLNISQEGDGNFFLFLFDIRPNSTNVNLDKTLNPDIYFAAQAYDSGINPSIFYNASGTKIHYIQIVLLKNGPDFFTLESTKSLTRYFLPSLPGYSLEIVCLSIVISLGLYIFLIKKRKITINR